MTAHRDPSGPILRYDPGSAMPAFAQISSQIAALIGAGELRPGDLLPPVRQLAGDLGLAPGTVARAYASLRERGLIRGARRHGSMVADAPADQAGDAQRARRLNEAAERYLAEARALGVGDRAALAAIARVIPDGPRTSPPGVNRTDAEAG